MKSLTLTLCIPLPKIYTHIHCLKGNQMQDIHFHNIIGTIGVSLILLCYFLIQIGKMSPENLRYSMINMIGASMILFSLTFEFNFASVLIEGFWVIISMIGIVRYIQVRVRRAT